LDTIFGAFLFGLTIPRGTKLYHQCREFIETFVLTFTLPLYFALSGIKTDITSISTGQEGSMVVLIVVLACVAKIFGCTLASLLSGLNFRESFVVGTLMNTKGLVELIVLNVGYTAGILTTRTFSVMVLMAVATTFITSPIVELVYPEKYRKIFSSDPAAATKEAEMIEFEGTDATGEADLATLTNRIGVVVGSLGQMQSFVNMLSYFIPYNQGSELSTTIMHFYEPTKSDQDKFIGLNEQGRLIRVDEEPTDISTALWLKEKDATIPKPELLPISSFCNAYHVPVNAFKIEGDPTEYPTELRSISGNNDLSLLLMPFKAHSPFAQGLFWECLKTAPAPMLLIAEVRPPTEKEIPVETEASTRSIRARTGSFINPGGYLRAEIDIEADLESPHEAPTLYTNVPANAMPIHRRRSVTNRFIKKAAEPKRNNVVLVLLLGKSSDMIILSLLPRMIQNKANDITVLLPKDYDSFTDTIQDQVKTTRENMRDSVKFRDIHSVSNDYDSLVNEINVLSYDLVLSSFVDPKEDPALRLLVTPENSYVNTDAVMRLISTRNVAQERITNRTASGMPDNCIYSNVVHPELGLFGSRLYEKNPVSSSLLVVVHEPPKLINRRPSVFMHQAEEHSTEAVAEASESLNL
jgi:hypothetical protein